MTFPILDVVLCEPEKADADLLNAVQLRGKVAVARRGGCSFVEKTKRAIAAGALALVIVNTEDRLFTPSAGDGQYASEIPVIMIRAKDEEALLSSGNSALLVHIGDKEASDRAAWETAVTAHVAQRATPALREVCSQAHAPLHTLLD